MAVSVNNNYAASVALQNLSATQKQLDATQNRISTGLRVANAKDDAATYAIAELSKGEVTAQKSILGIVNQGISLLAVTQDAGKKIADVLNRMLDKATAGQSATLTTQQRAALDADFQQGIAEINTIVTNASFNGSNIISSGATAVDVRLDTAGTILTLDATKLDATTLNLSSKTLLGTAASGNAAAVTPEANAKTAADAVRAAIATMATGLGTIGAWATRLENSANFMRALVDANNKAISNLIDADLAEESARLQSLQIKQQLGTQALSIANGTPQILLSLFKN